MGCAFDYDYERVMITGWLTCRTMLHVGSGFEEERTASGAAQPLSQVCLGAGDQPFIPASSLRGYLSARVRASVDDPNETLDKSLHERLFGTARRRAGDQPIDEDTDYGRMGALRVYDALWGAGQAYRPRLQTRVAIDPVTGTAKAHQLFSQALVPAGSLFRCRLELERIDGAAVDVLLAALNSLDGRVGAQLGAGKTLTQGVLRWRLDELRVLRPERFIDWLSAHEPLETFFEALSVSPPKGSARLAGFAHIGLVLRPQAPLLVTDPEAHKTNTEPSTPDRVFLSEGNRVRIPSSTLRGVVRARCRRILMTRLGCIASDNEASYNEQVLQSVVDEMIGVLFGGQDAMGLIRFSDALGRFRRKQVHRQWFNAIDRFTGGVADHRLYHVQAVWPSHLCCRISFDPRLLTKAGEWRAQYLWMPGLLVHVLRDAMEGDLALGWGKARGYGALRVALHGSHAGRIRCWTCFQDLLDASGPLERERLSGWLRALEQEVQERWKQKAEAIPA